MRAGGIKAQATNAINASPNLFVQAQTFAGGFQWQENAEKKAAGKKTADVGLPVTGRPLVVARPCSHSG